MDNFAPINALPPKPRREYIVALDLGSESMVGTVCARTTELIPMQEYAPLAFDAITEPDYLRDGSNRAPSPRLRNLIELQNNQPGPTLADDHARIEFFEFSTGIARRNPNSPPSLFSFFRAKGAGWPLRRMMPNPKVVYQYGVPNAFPEVRTTNDEILQELTPQRVIEHFTSLVLKNFVLSSSKVREIYRNSPEKIELVVTVPNVYTIAHTEALRQALINNTGIEEVSILSESDALIYYFRSSELIARRPDANDLFDRFVTIDIGKGTTDASVIEMGPCNIAYVENLLGEPVPDGDVENLREGERKREKRVRAQRTLARTGVSSGGSELSYIFARYLQSVLDSAFESAGRIPDRLAAQPGATAPPAFANAQHAKWQPEMPFNFLYMKAPALANEKAFHDGLKGVHDYAELLKTTATENHIGIPQEHRAEASRLLDIITTAVKDCIYRIIGRERDADGNWAQNEWVNRNAGRLDDLDVAIRGRFDIQFDITIAHEDAATPQEVAHRAATKVKSLFAGLSRKPATEPREPRAQSDTGIEKLRAEIAEYVRKNSDEMIFQLAYQMATDAEDAAEIKEARHAKRIKFALDSLIAPDRTYVVIGGQASHFKPLQARLDQLFNRTGNRPFQYEHLKGVAAKYGCCEGAIAYRRSAEFLLNPHQLFGFVYLKDIAGPNIKLFDLSELVPGKAIEWSPEDQTEVGRCLFFSARYFNPETEVPQATPLSDDIAESLYRIEFVQNYNNRAPVITLNSKPIEIATYGQIPEDVWPKLWPTILPEDKPQS